jgi:hypothetical protein
VPADADRRLERRARRRRGAFTAAQAAEDGVPESTLHDRARTGQYRRLQPSVYQLGGAPDSREVRYLAAVLAAGGEAVLSHHSAAHHHGLARPADRVHVLTRGRQLDALVGVQVHRTERLPDHHRTVVDGIPVTSLERTICDVSGVLTHRELRRVVAEASRRRRVTVGTLRRCAEELGRFRGKRMLARVLSELSPLEPSTRNDFESLFLRVTTRAGIPPTAMNHPVRDVHGNRHELDAVYLPERLPVELDSRRWHGTRLDVNDDRARENALKLVGWREFLRFSYWDVRDRPERVVAQIRAALAAARVERGDHAG